MLHWSSRELPTSAHLAEHAIASCDDRQTVKPSCFVQPALVAVLACDPGDVHLSATVAPDFAPATHSVSVLGVYKDGQISADGWESLAPRLGATLGSGSCEPGYNSLTTSNQRLADAIQHVSRVGNLRTLLAAGPLLHGG
jgi:hypothetical protein